MKDCLGNTISEKSLLCWHPDAEQMHRGIICQAVQVTDGGLSLGDSRQMTPPMLVIQIVIPVSMPDDRRAHGEPALADFMCVVNPQAEAAIGRMLAEREIQ
jgi:hypothetical protein